jgi:hypothetical protein
MDRISLAIFAILAIFLGCTSGAAVMSVDLGSEWMKVIESHFVV